MNSGTVSASSDNSGQTLTMSRRFSAPRERVFAAWVDRDLIAQWFGPETVTCAIHEWDAQEGGTYSLTMNHADGEKTPLSGVFQEISPPERLVYSWTWGGAGAMAGRDTLLTLELEADGDDTILHLTHSALLDEEWAHRHNAGWDSSFENLAAFLAS